MFTRLLAIAGLLLLNGYFVAAEFALVRSRRTRLEAIARTGDRLARLALRATGRLPQLLSASQLGITMASLILGALAEQALGPWVGRALHALPKFVEEPVLVGMAAAIAIAVVTFFHVVFGELAPRSVALAHPEDVARWLSPPLMLFERVVRPFTSTLNGSANLILRIFRQPAQLLEESVHSPDELRIMVEQSQESGALETTDADMIEGVFEFSEKNARDVMTPRTAVDAIPSDATLDEILTLIEETGRSRYPVYEDSIDNITGVVLTKDLIPVLRSPPPSFVLQAIVRPVHVVPGSREVEEVLADFKRLKEHLAVVLDEYGGTAGLVTMEDLLEEIVGDILDEYDEPPDLPTREGAHTVIVPGSTDIQELNERFGLSVPDEDYTTIAGFVFGVLGRLPVVSDRVTAGKATFVVREMDGKRIESLALDLHSGDRRPNSPKE